MTVQCFNQPDRFDVKVKVILLGKLPIIERKQNDPKSCTRVVPNPKNGVSKPSNKLSVLKTLVFETLLIVFLHQVRY